MLQLPESPRMTPLVSLEDAYELCRQVIARHSTTFYMGTLLLPEVKRQAFWAIYAWCRRTDELVDGPQAEFTTEATLDHWEQNLESVFAGHPLDDFDVALVNTLEKFPVEIQPFRDMIAGQRMDLYRSRYATFEELNLYCYRVAGTVGLMSKAIMGLDVTQQTTPWFQQRDLYIPREEAIALGIAKQLTNILRDVGEDARRGRIYSPLEDLASFNYSEQDLLNSVVDDRWRELMKFQIQRARRYYTSAEHGIRMLNPDARFPLWAALMFYRRILEVIERNQYDVFNKRAFVPNWEKFLCLPLAKIRAEVL